MARKRKKDPVKAAGRYVAYASTRYSSKGSKKTHPTLKTAGIVAAGGIVGGVVPVVGSFAGAAAGRHIAAQRGYVHRTKQRASLRHLESDYFKAQPMVATKEKQIVAPQAHDAFKTSVAHHRKVR